MRIHDGKEPLDTTGIHPESYEAARGPLDLPFLVLVLMLPGRKKKSSGGNDNAENS